MNLDISYRSLIRIALPLSLGAFVQFIVVLTDNLFLSDVGAYAINSAGNGGLLYITAVMLATGLASGVQILIARRKGEGRIEDIARWFGAGMRTVMGLAVLIFLLFRLFDAYAYQHWIRDVQLREMMREFLDIRLFGLFVYFPTLILNSLFIGIARTRILTWTMVLTAGVNIVFDYFLIYGHAGFPEMQHRGAALATFIAECSGLVFMIASTAYLFRPQKGILQLNLFNGLFTRQVGMFRKLITLSAPLMLQQVLVLGTWTFFFFLVEKIGVMELKVSHLVRNMYMLAFVAIYGIGFTTRTVVSTLIAEKRQPAIGTALKRLILMNVTGSLILCHGLILYPDFIASFFFSAQSAGYEALVKSFQVAFFVVLLFSVSGIFLNTVEGSGRTRDGLLIEIGSVSFYLLAVYYVTVVSPSPIHIVWMTDYIYFGVLGVLSLLYLRFSNWKYHQV